MKFCCSLAFSDASHYLELARVADACGWDSLSLSDHVVHLDQIDSRYPYREDGERPWNPDDHWPDVWVAAAAMAARTERLRFITGVYVLPMRHPLHVAKALGTASFLSQGRISLGLGLGWMRDEFEVLDAPFSERGARADEMIEVMRKVWTGEPVSHEGRFFRFERLRMRPGLDHPVPIIVGGSSDAALRRCARIGDGWFAHLLSSVELGEHIEAIRAYRGEFGRSPEFEVYGPATDAFDLDGYRRLEELGVTHLLTQPWIFYGGATDDLEAKKEGLRRFSDDILQKLT